MKTYELIIERQQPPCGGKPAKVVEVRSVTTDDPVAYVPALWRKVGSCKSPTVPTARSWSRWTPG